MRELRQDEMRHVAGGDGGGAMGSGNRDGTGLMAGGTASTADDGGQGMLGGGTRREGGGGMGTGT